MIGKRFIFVAIVAFVVAQAYVIEKNVGRSSFSNSLENLFEKRVGFQNCQRDVPGGQCKSHANCDELRGFSINENGECEDVDHVCCVI